VKLTTRKIAVIVTGLALAASSPVLVQADQGGVPHKGADSCKAKKKPKKHAKKKAQPPNQKGKKCGWKQEVAAPVAPVAPVTTTTTESTTTTTTATP
jgi:hypothetical protein